MSTARDSTKKIPLYNIDISFYVFKLDFIEEANQLLIVLLIAFALLTVIYYSVLLSVRTPQIFERVSDDAKEDSGASEENAQSSGYGGGTAGGQFGGFDNINDMFGKFAKSFQNGGKSPFQKTAKPKKQFDHSNLKLLISIAEKQLIIVGVLFFLMVGVNFFLKQYDLLFGSTGAVYGAGFTDVMVTLWVYRIIMGLSVLAAIGFAVGITKKKFKPAAIAPIAMLIVGAVGVGGALVVQNLVVTPDEINKESKYLERNIEYTQSAYGLNEVDMKGFEANQNLTSQDIANNSDTISNIRINDYAPAKTFLQSDAEYPSVLYVQRCGCGQIYDQRGLYTDVPVSQRNR